MNKQDATPSQLNEINVTQYMVDDLVNLLHDTKSVNARSNHLLDVASIKRELTFWQAKLIDIKTEFGVSL